MKTVSVYKALYETHCVFSLGLGFNVAFEHLRSNRSSTYVPLCCNTGWLVGCFLRPIDHEVI